MVKQFATTIRSVYFSGAACIILLVLCAVPKINGVILDEDTSSAFTLNSVVGRSPVMDHLVLAFSDRSADERALILLFVVAVVYISSARDRRHLAERLALVVFLAATCAAGVASEEFIEQTVRRRSPSLELTNFKDIEKLYDFDVDERSGDTFPSDDGFGYFLLGFILLRLGYRVGLGLIVGGLVFPLARCVVGSQWISDIYLGALPMSVFISAVITETRVVRLREVLESRILNGLDRSRLVIRRLLHLTRYLVRWRRENIITIHAAVKRYANTEVRKLLSLEQSDPLNLEMPLTGNKSLIWYATSGNRKALLRAYPLSMQIKAELHREASFLLQEHNVKVPAILDYQFEPTRYPAIIMLEEYVEGESLRQSQMSSEHIQAMASQFSRMHAIRNQAWGRLGYERSEGFCSVIMRHVERDLAVARRTNLLTDLGLKNYLHDWFMHWKVLASIL